MKAIHCDECVTSPENHSRLESVIFNDKSDIEIDFLSHLC